MSEAQPIPNAAAVPPVVPGATPPVPPVPPVPPAAPVTGEPTSYVRPMTDPTMDALLAQASGKQPAKEEPKQEPAKPVEKPTGGLNDLKPEEIENPQVRALGELLLSTVPDLDLERALGKAIAYGDAELVDTAYLKDIGGPRASALTQLSRQIVEHVKAQSEQTLKAVYAEAGDETQWNAAVAFFNKNAKPEIREVTASLLDSHDHKKIKSGARFIIDYAKQNGALADKGEVVEGQPGAAASANALSKTEFIKELRALKPEYANPNFAQERAALFERRTAGKKLGR